jgi:MraZ protein
MFRGNHPARVDEKGRLKLPVDFKRRVDELYGPQFFITSKDGKRAEIYPMKEWEKVEEKLASIPSMDPAKKKFLDVTNYYGQVVEFDAQGRLLLPQTLRAKANLVADVAVLGFQNYLVVVNEDALRAELEANALNTDDEAKLATLGL